MIYETFGALDELVGRGEGGVGVKCGFIGPTGVKPKQTGVSYRAEGLNGDAAGFNPNTRDRTPQLGGHRLLFPLNSVKSREDHELF